MDDFLVSLYEEEREKIAAADLGGFMGTLPVDELEGFLGLTKVGVGGPAEPELPTEEGGKLARDQKKADAEASQLQGQGSPNRNKEASVARIMKIAMQKTSGILEDPRYIAAVADDARKRGDYLPKSSRLRKFRENPTSSRVAMGASGALMGSGFGGGFGHAIGGKKGAIAGALIGGVGLGAGGAALGGKSSDLNRRIYAEMDKQEKKEKRSQGFGEEDMGGVGGMETTAAMKAKIAMRSMRVTEGAPPHIKRAAARFAGKEIAKLAAKKDDKYSVKPGYLAGQKAQMRALSGSDANKGAGLLADPTLIGNRQIGGLKGGLLGGGIGAGIGTLAGGAASLLSRGKIRPDAGVLGGAAIGGLGGALVGQTAGMYDADKRFLAERGVRPTMLGMGRGRFTPEAAQKYLRPDELEDAKTAGVKDVIGRAAWRGKMRAKGPGTHLYRAKMGPDESRIRDRAISAARALRRHAARKKGKIAFEDPNWLV